MQYDCATFSTVCHWHWFVFYIAYTIKLMYMCVYMYVQYLTDTQVANMFCVVDDFLAKAPCYFCSYSLQIIKLRVANYLCNRSNHTHKHTTGLSVNFIASISLTVLPLQVQIAIFRNIFAFAQYTCDHVSYCKILSKRSA